MVWPLFLKVHFISNPSRSLHFSWAHRLILCSLTLSHPSNFMCRFPVSFSIKVFKKLYRGISIGKVGQEQHNPSTAPPNCSWTWQGRLQPLHHTLIHTDIHFWSRDHMSVRGRASSQLDDREGIEPESTCAWCAIPLADGEQRHRYRKKGVITVRTMLRLNLYSSAHIRFAV